MTHARSLAAGLFFALLPLISLTADGTNPPVQATDEALRVALTAGRSSVVSTDFDITRIAVTDPAVADAVVVQPREVLINGKVPGVVSLIVWGAGCRVQYDIAVQAGVTPLEQRLQALYPGEDIHVDHTDEALILSGHVSSNVIKLRSGEIAAATSSKVHVVNLLQVPGGSGSQQVMLQVRFGEVDRTVLTNLGVSFFTGPNGSGDWIGRTTTEQFPAPKFETRPDGKNQLTFSDFLNLFIFNSKHNLGSVITALKQTGHFQSLAEPNLLAYDGHEASFLAGGEIPIPVVQGITNAVTIQYKEFGVRLTFTPTIAGDVIRLHVRPEVSTVDFTNGITLAGFRIPALTTRRAETEVELRDGQSFAIAGLMNNLTQVDRAKLPGLGDIPILGDLFKSKADRKEQTELLVLISPKLVRPLNDDELPPLPTDPSRFLPRGGSKDFPKDGGKGAPKTDEGGSPDAAPVVTPPGAPAPSAATAPARPKTGGGQRR